METRNLDNHQATAKLFMKNFLRSNSNFPSSLYYRVYTIDSIVINEIFLSMLFLNSLISIESVLDFEITSHHFRSSKH